MSNLCQSSPSLLLLFSLFCGFYPTKLIFCCHLQSDSIFTMISHLCSFLYHYFLFCVFLSSRTNIFLSLWSRKCMRKKTRLSCFNFFSVFMYLSFLGKEHNFKKQSEEDLDPLNAPYDTGSIMHYGRYTFNKNGRPTIEVIGNPYKVIGQRFGFSKTDIEQLNALYDCSNDGKFLRLSLAHIHLTSTADPGFFSGRGALPGMTLLTSQTNRGVNARNVSANLSF